MTAAPERRREPRALLGCAVAAALCAGCVASALAVGYGARHGLERRAQHVSNRSAGRRTVADRLAQHGAGARGRLRPHFRRAGVPYPPARLVFVGLKAERRLEVYAAGERGELRHVRAFPILGMSGGLGPKLREGDRQAPEGLYRVDFLNPNSTNHLSMRIDYPNAADRRQARREGRRNLGGEIYIHGKRTSAGCLAMGDRAAEDLFVLVADTGKENVEVILSPMDLRERRRPRSVRRQPAWVQARYGAIEARLKALPR